jgi:hypothetical protein
MTEKQVLRNIRTGLCAALALAPFVMLAGAVTRCSDERTPLPAPTTTHYLDKLVYEEKDGVCYAVLPNASSDGYTIVSIAMRVEPRFCEHGPR